MTVRESAAPKPKRPGTKREVFTGWKVVGASSLIWALQSMLWTQGFGNLAVELRKQFGWSKSLFALSFAGTRLLGAVMGPAHGRAIEHFGIKAIMRTGAFITLAGFLSISLIQSRAQFVVALLFTMVGISLVGFLTVSTAIVGWFERRRSRAFSTLTMGFALGGFAGPAVVAGYNLFGWRWTTAASGLVLFATTWWASSVVSLDRQQSGEPLDGLDPDTLVDVPRAEGVQDRHFTAPQALRTRAFWMISLGHGSALLVVSAVMSNLTLYLTEDRGYTAGRAAVIAGLVPVFQLVGTALGGYLGDRMNKRLIAGVAMCTHGAALLILTWVSHWGAIGVFVAMHGLAWGARGPQMQAIRADYFGSTSFARIMGWSTPIVTLGSVIGPIVAGTLADSTGDYKLGFTIIAVAAIAGTAFWVFASPPPTPAS